MILSKRLSCDTSNCPPGMPRVPLWLKIQRHADALVTAAREWAGLNCGYGIQRVIWQIYRVVLHEGRTKIMLPEPWCTSTRLSQQPINSILPLGFVMRKEAGVISPTWLTLWAFPILFYFNAQVQAKIVVVSLRTLAGTDYVSTLTEANQRELRENDCLGKSH